MTVPEHARARLEQLADRLIPAAHDMPAASAVGVGRDRLDAVLRSRPDLAPPLLRALARDDVGEDWLDRLEQDDPAAGQALVLVVLAGYYASTEVTRRLGYPGQEASAVHVGYPEYVTEGLLDAVVAGGPRYRDPDRRPEPGGKPGGEPGGDPGADPGARADA
jgi:hypothetical protein